METTGSDGKFSFVHPSIVEFFVAPRDDDDCSAHHAIGLNATTLTLGWSKTPADEEITMIDSQELRSLALECDALVFCEPALSCFRPALQGLVELGKTNETAKITVATLLALNALESAIRLNTKKTAGHAPLLKIMLDQIENKPISAILKALLLPTPGLNLRNLLWHGFVSVVPRSYLSLVLMLVFNLEYGQPIEPKVEPTLVELRKLPTMTNVLHRAEALMNQESILSKVGLMKAWLPVSHHLLFDLAIGWIQERQRPACICAILSILLEHGLRLKWCTLNNRFEDRIARPGAFYVTLDGHGQRHQHDLLLHPYLSYGSVNLLIDCLGGSTVALLTDLFCSSCGGPNLRAALSHGLWDSILCVECEILGGSASSSRTYCKSNEVLWDFVGAVLVAMEGIAEFPTVYSYRPAFSYTAVTIQNIQKCIQELEYLQANCRFAETFELQSSLALDGNEIDLASKLFVSLDSLRECATKLFAVCGGDFGNDSLQPWDAEDVFAEHKTNRKLSGCGASRVLLDDIALALLQGRSSIEDSPRVLHEESGQPGRHCHRHLRVLSTSPLAFSLYSFATFVALLSIEGNLGDADQDTGSVSVPDFQNAVERSRMVVSTFSTFLTKNSERAVKAAVNYSKAKCIRFILSNCDH
jgi:hypothetical protein